MKKYGKDNPAYKHGYHGHKLYQVWVDMMSRCNRKTHKFYPDYGGRGIKICNEWTESKEFIDWSLENGWEDGLQIDRIDNDQGYSPENCRFVTSAENSKNKRLIFKNNKSGFRGVHFNKKDKKYRAQVKVNGNVKYLGMHSDPQYAAVVRDTYVIRCNLGLPLNFPELLEIPA